MPLGVGAGVGVTGISSGFATTTTLKEFDIERLSPTVPPSLGVASL